jgi:hypothetical protein
MLKISVTSKYFKSVISGFRCDDEICAVVWYYAASSGNHLPSFQDNVSVPYSRVKKSKMKRKTARRYTVYIGKGVGGDWYIVSVMTANRVEMARDKGEGGAKFSCFGVYLGKPAQDG